MGIFTRIAILVFTLVAMAHFSRLILDWEMSVAGFEIPFWVSILGILIPGTLACGLCWESGKKEPKSEE